MATKFMGWIGVVSMKPILIYEQALIVEELVVIHVLVCVSLA